MLGQSRNGIRKTKPHTFYGIYCDLNIWFSYLIESPEEISCWSSIAAKADLLKLILLWRMGKSLFNLCFLQVIWILTYSGIDFVDALYMKTELEKKVDLKEVDFCIG